MAARGMGRGKSCPDSEKEFSSVNNWTPPTKVIEPHLNMLNKKARLGFDSPPDRIQDNLP